MMCTHVEPIERKGVSEEPAQEEQAPGVFLAQMQRFEEVKRASPQQRFLPVLQGSPGPPMEEPRRRRGP